MGVNLKRGVFLSVFFLLALIIIFVNFLFIDSFFSITGKVGDSLSTGRVILGILGYQELTIFSPENITYYFNKSSFSYYAPVPEYQVDLNVTASFDVEDWRYEIEQTAFREEKNIFHSALISSPISSKLSIPLSVFRWSNDLTVFARPRDLDYPESSSSVNFFVNVENSEPWITGLDKELFLCEGDVLLSRDPRGEFFVEDRDEDYLGVLLSDPRPFNIQLFEEVNSTMSAYRITSELLTKQIFREPNSGSRMFPLAVSVFDPYGGVGMSKVNITVLEVNNPPRIDFIGSYTVHIKGEDTSFEKEILAGDFEDGGLLEGELEYWIDSLDSEINLELNEEGKLFFESDETYLLSESPATYYFEFCVKDKGLSNPHPMLTEYCGNGGGSETTCEPFSITVTNANRRPVITAFSPSLEIRNVNGSEKLFFNVSVYDPDGNIPDIYWQVGNKTVRQVHNRSEDSFEFSFGCGVSGRYKVTAIAFDGLLEDVITWDINLTEFPCPKEPPKSGGGGGGGGGGGCFPNWICDNWNTCQNLEKSMRDGFLIGEDYRVLKEDCEKEELDEITCGFQSRTCLDSSECNSYVNIPTQLHFCYYTEDPSCFDGIRNCHSNGCEIGIDCGGPCDPCPTCTDKIRNQGEEGVDCGGPCPWPCPKDYPLKKGWVIWFIIGIFLILLILLLVVLLRVIESRRALLEKRKREDEKEEKK